MSLTMTLTPTPTLTPTLTLARSAYTCEIRVEPERDCINLPYTISPRTSHISTLSPLYLPYTSPTSAQANFAVNHEGDYVKGHKGSPFLASPNPN